MTDIKYDTNIASHKNIITIVISLIITYTICSNKGKKRNKKPFKIFSKSFNFISELWTGLGLEKEADKEAENKVKIEKAEIIHL